MFSEELKKIRLENGLTQKAAAEKLGVPLRTYESWERNIRCPAEYVGEAMLVKLKIK